MRQLVRRHSTLIKLMTIAHLALLGMLFSSQALSAKPPLVVVQQVTLSDYQRQLPLTGTLASANNAHVSTKVSGIAKQVDIEVGDVVAAGERLIHLDSELAEHSLESAKAATQQGRAELTDAKRRFDNGIELRKTNSISNNELELLAAEVEIKKAALARLQAEERRFKTLLKWHDVTAPFKGAVSERHVELGEWLTPGDPVVTLVSLEHLRAEFRVPQEYYSQVKPGHTVKLTSDALANTSLSGSVEKIVPVNDPRARTFLIHVAIDNRPDQLTPGMSLNALLAIGAKQQQIMISRDALIRYPDGRISVWTASQPSGEATVQEQRVEIGQGYDNQVPVLSGLKQGDYIVVQGNESLTQGKTVRIKPAVNE